MCPIAEAGEHRDEVKKTTFRINGILKQIASTVNLGQDRPCGFGAINELGFKQVKWIEAIEFVADFAHLGAGQGGYNEDHEFYGYRMPI